MHKIVNGERVELTPVEVEELQTRAAQVIRPITPAPAPTKEQLLAQLQALQAQIQALE